MLAKPLGKNPREIAQTIVDSFSDQRVSKLEIAGPGFINLFLTNDTFKELATDLIVNGDDFFKTNEKIQNYNIEFVSANPTGPLHLGHGRGGIIGDVLGNVLTFIGHNVTKEHYINDAGSQMEKLGNSLRIRCQQINGKSIELPEDAYQGEYLKALALQCIEENGSDVLKNDNQFFIEYGYKHLLDQLKSTVQGYGINFDVWFSEKTLHPGGIEAALKTLEDNKKTFIKDDALWFRSTEYGDDKDRVLKKADGDYTYAAADAAYMLDKAQRGFNHSVIILGQDHHSYPKRLEGIRQALGIDMTLDCILYQLVSIKEGGKKMKLSKRAGRIVGLADITEEVGTDIARFFYLNRKADAHLDFDMDLALSQTDDNPVYYLQYAYVRTNSLMKKASLIEEFKNISKDDVTHLTEKEHILLKKILELKELLTNIGKNYQVHMIAYYLLEISHLFHNYYHHNRVVDPEAVEQSRGRLVITQLVCDTFKRCLSLMGVSQPEKM
jgi:arginyl-tRNA synthetase